MTEKKTSCSSSIDDLYDRLEQTEAIFQKHATMEEAERRELKDDLAELKDDVKRLLAIWEQAKGAVRFIKTVTVVVSTLAGAWLFLRNNFTILPK